MEKWKIAGLGALAALLGLLPWLLQGMALPLQNLGSPDQASPLVLLPFNQYFVGFILAVFTVGMALSAVMWREIGLVPDCRKWFLGGTVAVQLMAIAQSLGAAASVMQDGPYVSHYFWIMLALITVSLLYGIATYVLLTARSFAAVMVGIVGVGVVLPTWVRELEQVFPDSVVLSEIFWIIASAAPFILVGWIVARRWTGLGPTARVVAPVGACMVMWVGHGLIQVAMQIIGTRAHYAEYVNDPGTIVDSLALFAPLVFNVGTLIPAVAVVALTIAVVVLVRRKDGVPDTSREGGKNRGVPGH